MTDQHDVLYKDMRAIRQISVIPNMLDAICRMTGLGFAAVARVTNDRWLACTVLDRVNFGLAEGEELKIETTICNEIRDSRQPVVIDHVALDDHYKDHHTPKMYGLQSYISFPIILKNGEFFGTLCAIGTAPAQLNDPKIRTTFEMFAELISFHLQAMDVMDRSNSALHETKRQLNVSGSEIKKYQKVSDHNITEQVRKITMFSDMLLNNAYESDFEKIKETATKINASAYELSSMMAALNKLSDLADEPGSYSTVDLNNTLQRVQAELQPKLDEKKIILSFDKLPVISAIPDQIQQLFYQLLSSGIERSKAVAGAEFKISVTQQPGEQYHKKSMTGLEAGSCKILLQLSGIDYDPLNLELAFDIFLHATGKDAKNKYRTGLAYSQKIVHNHAGEISLAAGKDGELLISIVLPLNHGVLQEA